MDLVKIKDNNRIVVKANASLGYFTNLMIRARKRFGLKSINNPDGFVWPNAHKNIFYAVGYEYRLEWMGDIDMDFLR